MVDTPGQLPAPWRIVSAANLRATIVTLQIQIAVYPPSAAMLAPVPSFPKFAIRRSTCQTLLARIEE